MKLLDRAKAIWNLFAGGKSTNMDKIILVLALLYCLSPVDIIPDVVPIVGLLDDAAAVLAGLWHFSRRARAEAEKDGDNAAEVDAKVIK